MKTVKGIGSTLAATLWGVAPARAAAEAGDDATGLLLWLFFGVCALVVVAQAVPAFLATLRVAREVSGPLAEEAGVDADGG
ncbi:MAG: hypothetical protein ACYDA8_08240 [Deferrisomatales bacterium]